MKIKFCVWLILLTLSTACNISQPLDADRKTLVDEPVKEAVEEVAEAKPTLTLLPVCIVPNVVDLDQSAAESSIANLGLRSVKSNEYSDVVATGKIISQDPAPNTRLDPCEGEVMIIASLGKVSEPTVTLEPATAIPEPTSIIEPSATVVPPTATLEPSAIPEPTSTIEPSVTAVPPTATPEPSATPEPTSTVEPSATAVPPTATPEPSATPELTSTPLPTIPPDGRLFWDDFETEVRPEWDFDGNYGLVNGDLVSDHLRGSVGIGNQWWTDYQVVWEHRSKGQFRRMQIRKQDDENYMLISKDRCLHWFKIIDGQRTKIPGAEICHGYDDEVLIFAKENTYGFIINGDEKLTFIDNSLSYGGVSFFGEDIKFDYFEILALP